MKKSNRKISFITSLMINGTIVPHFCYHEFLSIADNCQSCIVELKNSMKPVVLCFTNIINNFFKKTEGTH